MRPLGGRVAVVTGASRGAGRGIALVLGAAGATVYLTGRSVRGRSTCVLPGTTLEDTAEAMAARGVVGIPVRTDHTRDEEVEALFARVAREQGRLDLLVNNAWGGYEAMGDTFGASFWLEPMARFDRMFTAGVRSHMLTTRLALPLMQRQNAGLIINTTLEIDPEVYDEALFYRTAKLAINYMTFGMAIDLKKRGGFEIAAIALAPGWMRTEAVMENFRSGLHQPHELAQTESIACSGRAVLALATDPDIMQKSGKTLRARDLALEYAFTDVDGRTPI